ncbi:MAG: carbohydrate kinase family protein [Chthoniobacterales bacterium]
MSSSGTRSGLLAAGNFIIDHLRSVDAFPAEGTLATIFEESFSNGGGPYNVLKGLAKLRAPFPLHALGLIGEDADGDWIWEDLSSHGIDISRMRRTALAPTSYTEVMSSRENKQRTFFHRQGANALLDVEHFDFTHGNARLFYFGYLLLLERLDETDPEFGTRAARVLSKARESGLFTITDCVSRQNGRFKEIVLPALPYVDLCILNDFEAEQTTGIALRKNGVINHDALQQVGQILFAAGVHQWVVIHFPEGAFGMEKNGQVSMAQAVPVDPAAIVGSNGAGDAFAAGVILSLHEGGGLQQSLEWGCDTAAASLLHSSASDGIQPRLQ